MKIISDFSKDIQTDKPISGSYEWWYFDAVSKDGCSIVVIFYDGNPFSKKYIQSIQSGESTGAHHYPAISISVYDKNKPVFYSFEELLPENAFFSRKKPKAQIGENSFYGAMSDEEIHYKIELNQLLPNGDKIEGELTFISKKIPFPFSDNSLPTNKVSRMHTWNLVQPKAEVTGWLNISGFDYRNITFDGIGYHDHNYGSEPMKDSFDEWYWGRYHFNKFTLLYYIMNIQGEWEKKAWLLNSDGEVQEAISVNLKEPGLSLFGLKSCRKIEFEGADFGAFLQKEKMIDNGPFYQRFAGTMILKTDDTLQKSVGISEYIYPSRIYNRMFWPLVDMRIKYPGKVHWVQNNPVLFRWTW